MKKLLVLLLVPTFAHAGALELFNAGDFELATQAAQKELAANPDRVDTLLVLGRAQLAANRLAEAEATLRRASALQPPSAEAYYRLGQALTVQFAAAGAWRKALLSDDIGEAFERAVELEPGNAEYRWALFKFFRHAPSFAGGGRGKAEAQAAALARIDGARGHRASAELLEQDGRLAGAEAELRTAIAAAPRVADHRYALGYFQQRRERWTAAFGTFQEILRQFPDEAHAQFQVGRTAALSGQRLDVGIVALRRYLRHKPRADEPPRSWAHHRLGELYERQRRPDAAARQYRAALELDPAYADARRALRALGGS